jgi:TonB-linked SusC/RagA family outer membrane protein
MKGSLLFLSAIFSAGTIVKGQSLQDSYAANHSGKISVAREHMAQNRFVQDSLFYSVSVVSDKGRPVTNGRLRINRKGKTFLTSETGDATASAITGDTLFITAEGFFPRYQVLGSSNNLKITLQTDDNYAYTPDAKRVDLIYTSVPASLTAASSDVIYTDQIIKSPVTSVRSTLTGRLAGLYTLQSSGLPGSDGASLYLRSRNPLVLIDGVAIGMTVFNLEDLESATVLKDAVSTAMLGVRGSNGALVLNTRKGKQEKQQISFTTQYGIQQPIGFPKTLGAYDYARLYNEALSNDGLPLVYSQADLDAYQNKSDPYGHPDVNWRDQVLNKSSLFRRYTLSATGGNKFARYFLSLEHVNQSGLFKTVDSNKYNTNNNFKSYVIRSNVDIDITRKLTGGIYVLGRILNGNDPGAGSGNIIGNLLNTPNNAYPVFNANGSFGGTSQFQNNILAQTVASGYQQNYKRDMLANFYLKRKMDEVTPGLWIQAKAAYYATLSESIYRGKSFAVYQAVPSSSGGVTYNQYGTNGTMSNSNGIDYQGRTDYEEVSIGYDRVFKNKHGINALVLANNDNSVSGSDLPYTISGLSGRVTYNYKSRYVVEAAFGYNGSNRYPPKGSTRRGFFPAVGLSWNIDKEEFLRKYSWINRLKVYGSYGRTGWDDPGYFTYIQRFFDANSVYFGTSAGSNTAITEQPLANNRITFEKAQKLNVGIDAAFLKNRLSVNIEYYNNKFYDLLMQRGRNIAMLGNDWPRENIGQERYSGYEAKVTWQQSVKNFQYFVIANAGIQQTKSLFSDEVYREYDWMKRTGRMVGQSFGYIADGLFQSQDEISKSATIVGYTPQPGDIKYRDLNGDGVINQFDIAPIGRQKPLFIFGLSVGASYKGLDVSAVFQGITNRDIYLGGSSVWAFQNNGFGQAYENNLNRWTPATAATATYPRLNVGYNPNNQAGSSYWMKNGDFARLKNLEIGYSLPASLLKHARLQQVRLFISGYNLVTIASAGLGGRDPEIFNGFSYPMQKVYNFGINIKL